MFCEAFIVIIFLADGNPIVSMRRIGAKPTHFHLDERLKANASSSCDFQCVCQSSERDSTYLLSKRFKSAVQIQGEIMKKNGSFAWLIR
jgi:hypothetical protein